MTDTQPASAARARPFRAKLSSAILRKELLTQLRSGTSFVALFVFLAIVAGIVYLAWPKQAVIPAAQSQISRTLFTLFAVAQIAGLTVLAPALSAGSMTIEKERRTLDLLLTAPMRAVSIPWGKFWSSATLLGLFLLTTFPILSLCYLLGGVSWGEVVGLYVVLLLLAVLFILVGLAASTHLARTQAALATAYLVVLPVGALMGIMMTSREPHLFEPGWVLVTAQGMIPPILGLVAAIVRRMRRPFPTVESAAEEENVQDQAGLVIDRTQFPDRLLSPPPTDDLMPDGWNPVLWKELRSEVFGRGTLMVRLLIQIACGLSVFVLPFMFTGYAAVYFSYLLVFVMLIGPSFSSVSLSMERERGTMDLLRTTPLPVRQVLLGKFVSAFRCTGVLTLLLTVPVWMASLLSPETRLSEALLGLGILAAAIVSTTAIGIFFSLAMRTTLLSMVATYLSVLALYAGPIVAVLLLRLYTGLPPETVWAAAPLSPFFALFEAMPGNGREVVLPDAPGGLWPASIALHLGLSAALLLVAHARYHAWSEKNAAGQQV